MKTIYCLPHQLYVNTVVFLLASAIYAGVAAQEEFATFAFAAIAAMAIASAASTRTFSTSWSGYVTLSSLTAKTKRTRARFREDRRRSP